MIISRTPFRISFFGGGTDFPDYYRAHGGACLATTIDKYSYISLHSLAPFFKYRFHASYAKTELVTEPAEIQHPLIRETLLMLGIEKGLEIMHVSDLPGRTGLGTSSSFTVGLLNGLHTYRGEPVDAARLAKEAIAVERERVGDAGGHQDQYAAAFGGLMRITFPVEGDVSVRPIVLEPVRRRAFEDHLILFYTGLQQTATELQEEQRRQIGNKLDTLHAMRAMVDRAEALLTSGDLASFGQLLDEAWQLKKSLASGITNDLVDAAYRAAREEGALGGKLLGAGGRGFLLLFAPPDRHPALRERLGDLSEVPFAMSEEGSKIIFTSPE